MNTHMRSELYQCLAEVLADPPDWLALPGRYWPIFEAASALAQKSPAAQEAALSMLAIDAEPMDARRNRYEQMFAMPGGFSIGMYESGALHGKLLSAPAFAVAGWYDQFGLAIHGAEMPDHASLELALLAFLSAGESEERARFETAFLDQHASRWLPWLGRQIAGLGDPVYAPLGRLLAAWVEEVSRELGVPGFAVQPPLRRPRANHRLPAITRQEDCTLCSFCVPACPVNALAIHENASTTVLVLAQEACIGCGKCERACPRSVLKMQAAAGNPTEPRSSQVLRQSERAICRKCGTPMISQAELAYVAECLEHPDWLAYCPDCRFSPT
jgi:ferredoxin